MKKHMKKLMSLVMALAMILSLGVTAFAEDPQPSVNAVTTQGGLPTDLTDVVVPTMNANTFDVIFDSYGLIAETGATRYADYNNNEGLLYDDDTNFYFSNTDKVARDITGTLLADAGQTDTDPKKDAKVVQYLSATSVTSIYAKLKSDNSFDKWVKAAAADTVAADWAAADSSNSTPEGIYYPILALKDINPLIGTGLDAIDKFNEDNPAVYFQKGAVVSGTNTGLDGTIEYTFVADYEDNIDAQSNADPVLYAYITTDDNGDEVAATKIYTDLGVAGDPGTAPQAATNPTVGDFKAADGTTDAVKNATITIDINSTATKFYRQRESVILKSFRKTSNDVEIINKTNAPVGVSMKVELTNIPGGAGTKDSNGAWTYVYAKGYDSATKKFYNAALTDTTKQEITGGNDGVPVIYMALNGGDETAVMTYDSTSNPKKGVMSLGVALAGGGYGDNDTDLFKKVWNPDHDNGQGNEPGAYEYKLRSELTREKDFASTSFNITGAIDAENDAWNTLGAGDSAPKLTVTWSTEIITRLSAPSLSAATWVTKKAWVFTSDKNADSATLKKVTVNFANDVTKTIEASDITYANNTKNKTETFTIPATWMSATGNTTKPESVVFTFYDAARPFRTVDVTLTSY